MPYCPYTDQDWPGTETNSEHIIPLSLGGVNGFEIPVHRGANSDIGSSIDAAMAEDFLIKTQRDRFDVRGHSGKEPVFVIKRATNTDGLPLQVAMNQRSGLKVWSPRDREYITDKRACELQLRFSLNMGAAMKFVAKVALSAGYFVYGDLLRSDVRHQDFRAIMNFQPSSPDKYKEVEACVDDRFSQSTSGDVQLVRALCKASEPYSIVGFAHSKRRFGVFVGILGEYVGTIHAPATMGGFPSEGEHQMGHIIQLNTSGITRCSMRHALESLLKWTEKSSSKNNVDI